MSCMCMYVCVHLYVLGQLKMEVGGQVVSEGGESPLFIIAVVILWSYITEWLRQ